MFPKILNTQTRSISFAAIILTGSYFFSGLLGLARDHFLAGTFGAGNELDVYYAAFTVPDLIALLLVFGAISAAIIPIFSSYWVRSKEEAWEYTANLLNIFLVLLVVLCAAFILFAPLFVSFVAPGFSEEKKEMTTLLMRIMFLSPIILGISNMITGILQVFHRFLVTAMAPLLYNLGIIFGILFFVPAFGLPGLAFGVVIGALMHLAIQLPALFHSGFSYKRVFNVRHPGVIKTLKLMVPRSLGLGAGQINTIVTTAIASTLASGSIAVFSLANNFSSLFISAVAISLSTAIFPAMSLAFSKSNTKDFENKFSSAFRQIMFLSIPASFFIFILRAQITRIVWGSGRFDWIDTRLTAACLGLFGAGLLFQGLIFILSKTFYAAHNTRIPAVVSGATVALNIMFSFFFVWLLSAKGIFFTLMQTVLRLEGIQDIRVTGLALAYSLTALIESGLLLGFLYWKFKVFRLSEFSESFVKIILSSIVMASMVFFARQSLVAYRIIELETFVEVFLQLAVCTLVAGVSYGISSYLLGSRELFMIYQSFFKKMATVAKKNEPGTH